MIMNRKTIVGIQDILFLVNHDAIFTTKMCSKHFFMLGLHRCKQYSRERFESVRFMFGMYIHVSLVLFVLHIKHFVPCSSLNLHPNQPKLVCAFKNNAAWCTALLQSPCFIQRWMARSYNIKQFNEKQTLLIGRKMSLIPASIVYLLILFGFRIIYRKGFRKLII